MPNTFDLATVGCTNKIHPDEEARIIKAALNKAECTLHLLDIRFKAKGRRALVEEIRRYRVALAAYKKLPTELLQSIFRHCCHPDSPLETDAERRLKLDHPATAIMRACSMWRQIALNTPELWSSVRATNDDRGLFLTKRWFSRAGSTLRSLSIDSPEGTLIAFQELLSQYRFQNLDITFSINEDYEAIQFATIPVESLLPLRTLKLKNITSSDTTLIGLSVANHTFPNLETLSIGRYIEMPHFHRSNPFSAWHQLRELHLHCPLPQPRCSAILRGATTLEECSLRLAAHFHLLMAHLQQQTTWVPEAITAPNLRVLTLQFDDGHDAEPFLDLLILPRLNSLILGDGDRSHPLLQCNSMTFKRLVERSGMENLEEVVIGESIGYIRVGPLLQCLTFLRHLKVGTCDMLDDEIAENVASGKLGPRLRVLHILGVQNLERVLNMVESRQKTAFDLDNISRLKEVSFRARSLKSGKEHHRKRVDDLHRSGVDVIVRWI